MSRRPGSGPPRSRGGSRSLALAVPYRTPTTSGYSPFATSGEGVEMMRTAAKRLNDMMSRQLGLRLMRCRQLYPWQVKPSFDGSHAQSPLPEGAADYLRLDHPRLEELSARYQGADPRAIQAEIWTDANLPAEDLLYFRGDNAFVWQLRGLNRNALTYALCYYALKADDSEGLLDLVDEDEAFGIHALKVDGRLITRDLLDSVREIQFLRRHVGIGTGSWNILDIGAGYGRLAHRLSQAGGDEVQTFATDAFAPSTFLCEYYLRHRRAMRAHPVPLDEVDGLLADTRIDLVTNVHSFSECAPDAVAWWLEKIAAHKIRYLFVVPNEGTSGGTRCQTSDGRELEPIFAKSGYHPLVREPRYSDPLVQAHGIDPVWLHLFELA